MRGGCLSKGSMKRSGGPMPGGKPPRLGDSRPLSGSPRCLPERQPGDAPLRPGERRRPPLLPPSLLRLRARPLRPPLAAALLALRGLALRLLLRLRARPLLRLLDGDLLTLRLGLRLRERWLRLRSPLPAE